MVVLRTTKEPEIPIQRIISVACRNFMAFDGLHTFEFNEGVNTIVGGNSSGKTTLVNVILQAVSRSISQAWNSRWHGNFSQESLIEIKFIADDKEHYLRRVINGDTTTDLHLYIQNGTEHIFYRDGEVVKYLKQIKPVSTIRGFEKSEDDFYFWTTGSKEVVNPLFSKSKDLIALINRFLPITDTKIDKICVIGGNLMAQYRNGEQRHLSDLASGENNIIFAISKICNMLQHLNSKDLSKVIVIDEMDIGLDKSQINGLYDTISEISELLSLQFIITSRFATGRKNCIRLNGAKIPRCYFESKTSNVHTTIKNYLRNMNQGWTQKPPTYSNRTHSKNKYKFTYKKGSFRWKL